MNTLKFVTLGLGCLAVSSASFAAQNKTPNVLFIIMDDMCDWQNYLGGNNQVKTPNLDALAARGVYFSNAYTAVPLSNPSRTALMTGLNPSVTGIYNNDQQLQDSPIVESTTMMPTHFRRNGYTTLWSGKIFHHKPSDAVLGAMWDDMECRDGGYGPWADNPDVKVDKAGKGSNWQDIEEWKGPDTDFPDVINSQKVIDFLAQKHDKPFFASMGFYRPHTPLTAPKRYFDMYDINEIERPKVLGNDLEDVPQYAIDKFIGKRAQEFRKIAADGNTWEKMIEAYLACVSFSDDRIGMIVSALEKSPYADNTYIVVIGDNGFHHGEKERFGKSALWREACHVPFMIVPPKSNKRFVAGCRTTPVSLIDIYPTLTAVCNLPKVDAKLAGNDLTPLLLSPKAQWNKPSISTYLPGNFVVHYNSWNYIKYADGSQELYNIGDDEDEFYNVVDKVENRKIVEQLNGYLPAKWHKGVAPRKVDGRGRVVFGKSK